MIGIRSGPPSTAHIQPRLSRIVCFKELRKIDKDSSHLCYRVLIIRQKVNSPSRKRHLRQAAGERGLHRSIWALMPSISASRLR